MPIEKTPLQINFSRGLDQKTDPKQVKPGKFLGLKNRNFNKEGLLEKRDGYDAKGQSVVTPVGSFTFSQIPASVATGRNTSPYADELTLNDGLNFYSLSQTADNWVYKGRVELCQTSESSIYKNQSENLMPDSAINSTLGLIVYAWESWTAPPYQIYAGSSATLSGVQISVVDSATGQLIYTTSLVSTTSRPKCVSIGNNLYVLYWNSADNRIYAQPVTQSGPSAAISLITNADTTTPNYDAIVNNSLLYIGYNGTGSTVKGASFNSSLSAQATVSKSETAGSGIGLFADTSNNVWFAYNNGSETKAFIMDSALSVTVLAPTVVDNGSGASGVKNVTGVYDGTRGIIYYDKPGNPVPGQDSGYSISASFTQPAVGSTVIVSFTPSDLSSPGFFENNSIVYIPTGGYYFMSSAIVGSTPVLANLGYSGNAAPAATVASTRQIIYPTAGYQNSIVTYNTLTAAGVAGSAQILMRSVYLAGKAFLVNSVPHVITGFDSPLQATYYATALYNINSLSSSPRGVVVAKVGESAGGSPPYRSILPNVNTVSTGIVQFAFNERAITILRTSNNDSNSTFRMGVSSATVDFTENDVLAEDLGGNLLISSGLMQMYDGAATCEQGFNYYPETVTVVGGDTSATDGDLDIGTYGYKVVYQWIDNKGQVHRSAPSPNLSFTILDGPANFTADTSSGSAILSNVSSLTNLQIGQRISGTGIPANTYIAAIRSSTEITMSANATATNAGITVTVSDVDTTTLTIPTLRITEKQNATIAVYRTTVNGSGIYYRLDTQYVTYPIANSVTTDSITFVDVNGDYSITGNEQLYTGQEVENIAPDAPLFLTEYKNRAIYIPSGNRYQWGFSKQIVNGSPVEFSDLFLKNMGTAGGELVGAHKLDDKLILFKPTSLYYVTGTGPSPSGANDDFSDPQFITADAGLADPRSLVTTPDGVMFKSTKGIYLLDRSLQTRYIGKAVEDFNQYTVRGARLLPKANQVRFILSNGQALVYNYFWKDEEGVGQWSVNDPTAAVSDCIFQDLHTYVTSAGVVYQETPGTYLDGASGIATYFKTGWFNLAGLQGFERAYFFYFLAEYISSHTLTINIYHDYSTTASQSLTITPNSSDLEQWRVFLSQQKCQAFQIELTESGATGAGFKMSGLDLVVGLKKGYVPIKAAASAS